MTRKVDVSQLVGAKEIAERLGYKQAVYVHALRRRYEDFPEPIADLSAALIWDWPDVEAWARATGRLK